MVKKTLDPIPLKRGKKSDSYKGEKNLKKHLKNFVRFPKKVAKKIDRKKYKAGSYKIKNAHEKKMERAKQSLISNQYISLLHL